MKIYKSHQQSQISLVLNQIKEIEELEEDFNKNQMKYKNNNVQILKNYIINQKQNFINKLQTLKEQ